MLTRNARPLLFLVAVVTLVALVGGPAVGTSAPARPPKVSKIKQVQRRMITEEARERFREVRAALRRGRTPAARGERARDEGLAPGEELARQERLAQMARAVGEFRTQQALAPNVRANNPATDIVRCPPPGGPLCSTQSEESIAALGRYVLVAWNDGEKAGLPPTNNDVQGYAFSSDSGSTFTDGGVPPKGLNWTWVSDPVVTVNEKTGTFYFLALADSTALFSGIGIVPATFSGTTFTWGTPVMVRKVTADLLLLDKPWVVADSTSDSLYVSYTTFTVSGSDYIQFQRSANGVAWTPEVTLSAAADSGYVQGPRPAVGPNGELYVVWSAAGPVDVDFFRIRKSTNAGTVFSSQVTFPNSGNPALGFYGNWGTGAPGFNRERGVTYPSIAVDRSSGSNRGRVYVTWNESINFYDDWLVVGSGVSEPPSESGANDTPGTATPFTVNNRLSGAVGSSTDFDYWRFSATQGQTGVFYMDLPGPALDISFRLFCTDGVTRLGFSNFGVGGQALIVFTFPETGTYYLRCAGFDGTTGTYRINTKFSAPGPERARDHRDVFITSSLNGTTWSNPLRVNQDAGRYDNWLPEVAVSGQGRAFVSWYDWRDSPAGRCGGLSHVYLARSDDGGSNWIQLGQVTDAQSDWTNSSSFLAPNQGDYMGLFANANGVYPAWADVRPVPPNTIGDPDVYAVYLPLLVTPVAASFVSAEATREGVTLTWDATEAEGLLATIYRRTESTDWAPIGQLNVPSSARVVFVDKAVVPGARYQYRVGIVESGSEKFFGEAWVSVPRFALEISSVAPNPAQRDLWVSFTLPSAEPATLRLIDIAGREVRHHEVSAASGPQRVNLAGGSLLPMGIYAVKLTQGTRTVTTRVSVVR